MAGTEQCQFTQVAHERGVQELVADKTCVVVQGHFRIVQLDIQALGVQGLAIDANVTKVTQQQTIQLTVSTHHHEAVLLVGFERHAIHQVDVQQRRHGNRQVIIEERQHGFAVVTTLSQLHPVAQQRLFEFVDGEQAADRHGQLAFLQQGQRVVAVQHGGMPGPFVIGRLWRVMNADALRHDVQQALNPRFMIENLQYQLADARSHPGRAR
ncbi:hypothetical protein D3C71_1423470 [compost metagenome]